MPSTAIIDATDLHLAYSIDLPVVERLTFQLRPQEIVAIVGASGCGKTTILRALAGLIRPYAGHVRLAGLEPVSYAAQGKLAFLLQEDTLLPWRTALANVRLPTQLRPRTDGQMPGAVALEMLDLLGIAGAAHLYPSQLSGGMKQRVAMARALAGSPELLLLDEPFGALDMLTREALWLEQGGLWRQRKLSVVVVTHDLREAVVLADEILVLKNSPATIAASVPSTLAVPRKADDLYSDKTNMICRRLLSELRA